MNKEITIANPILRRKWGFGYSTVPTGEDAYSIQRPGEPDYEGTIKQVLHDRANDRAYRAYGAPNTSNYKSTAWFWDGHPIQSIKRYGLLKEVPDLSFDEGQGETDEYREWDRNNSRHHFDNDVYGLGWFYVTEESLLEAIRSGTEIEIRIAVS